MDIESSNLEEDSILDHTSKFRSYTENLKQQLSDLLAIRKEKIDRESDAFNKLYSKIIYNLTSLRTTHRNLSQEIEKNRIKNQKEKETLDENISYLESLNYQVNSLNRLINGCHAFQTPSLNKINEVKQTLERIRRVSKEDELTTLNEELLSIIKQEYEARKQLKGSFEELETKKSTLKGNCEEKNRFLTKLPAEIKKISELMKTFIEIFKINEGLHPEQGLLAKQLPQPLHNIYYKFSGLSLSKMEKNLTITIIRKDKLEIGKYKMDPLELVLVIEETPEKKIDIQNLIKKFKYQNLDLNSIYPIKIFIRYLVDFDIVVLQLDNKNFFTTEELITNLVKNDSGSQIFLNPSSIFPLLENSFYFFVIQSNFIHCFLLLANEQERNINNKYQFYKFLQNISQNSSFFQPQILTNHLSAKIRNRVFFRIILKCILEDLKKDFFGTLDSFSHLEKNPKVLYNEKFTLKSFSEINFEEYQAGLKVPEVFRKIKEFQSKEERIEKIGILETVGAILKEKEERRLFEKYEVREEWLREHFGMEILEDHSIYMKVEAEIKKIMEITLFIKIPADYPYEASKFTIYANLIEEKTVKIPAFLADKTKKLTKSIRKSNKSAMSPFELSRLENKVNSNLGLASKEENIEHFAFILQLQTIFNQVSK